MNDKLLDVCYLTLNRVPAALACERPFVLLIFYMSNFWSCWSVLYVVLVERVKKSQGDYVDVLIASSMYSGRNGRRREGKRTEGKDSVV